MKRLAARFPALLILTATILAAPLARAQTTERVESGTVQVTRMVSGLREPWAIGFLPGGGTLITERGGRLLHLKGGESIDVSGVPRVAAAGQGGLLDVVVARNFTQSREIFLSFSEPRGGGAGTAMAVARLSDDGTALEDLRVIFSMRNPTASTHHFGSRLVEAPDGTLFLTIGERGDRDKAQDVSVHNGKVIRITRTGSIPPDNPFKSGDWLPEIWSYGHRNPQGAALDADGVLWINEHGAQGGDEVNRPEAGANYGWPVISYGRHYDGGSIGIGTEAPGMEQPLHYWDPSIAPSGMMIYSGRLFPDWQGDFFVGSLKFNMISRLERSGDALREAERLFQDRYPRIRDIREAPDGSIWFLSVGDGAAYRITPG